MFNIAGFGMIGPTGERLSTSAASPAEVQRLTETKRSQPAAPTAGGVGSSAPRESVRVTLSSAALAANANAPTAGNGAPATQPATATQTSYAVQRAQSLYGMNATMPVTANATSQNGAKTLR
ncbi:hypothetical protein JCM16106_17720 [Hydrogenophilus islandicus]|jgi:hypothetical protein